METVTVPILEDDLQKLQEVTAAMNKGQVDELNIKAHQAAFSALREGIAAMHKSWVTDK